MKIYYWAPFFSNVATINAVIRSAKSIVRYDKKSETKVTLIDAIGEWNNYGNLIKEEINIVKLNHINFINYIPKNSYIKSRISYLFIFFLNFFKLLKLINKDKPDYLIIHLMTSLPIMLSFFFNKKTKIILRISGLPKLNIFRYLLWKIFSKKLYMITCPTLGTFKYIDDLRIFEKKKLMILKDPIIDIKKFIKNKNELIDEKIKKKKFIVAIGRLTKQKNFLFLISCFYKIQKKFSEYSLIILGEGEERKKIENLILKYNISNKVHLLGYEKNVFKYLVNSKYFILSSLWEDPGFVLVEAGMANTIILSSDCPNGPKEIVENESFLYKSNNEKDLIKKFELIENMEKDKIFLQKIKIKKRLKDYTMFKHYKSLKKILN